MRRHRQHLNESLMSIDAARKLDSFAWTNNKCPILAPALRRVPVQYHMRQDKRHSACSECSVGWHISTIFIEWWFPCDLLVTQSPPACLDSHSTSFCCTWQRHWRALPKLWPCRVRTSVALLWSWNFCAFNMDAWILRIMFGCYGSCLETPEIRHFSCFIAFDAHFITSFRRRRSWMDKGLPPRCIARPKRTKPDVIEKQNALFSLRLFPFCWPVSIWTTLCRPVIVLMVSNLLRLVCCMLQLLHHKGTEQGPLTLEQEL